MPEDPTIYDICIIGAGFAGLTAAIYSLRGGKNTLILESTSYGGQIINAEKVENWPTRIASGLELSQSLYEQLKSLNTDITLEEVERISQDDNIFTVKTTENVYKSRTVILASGSAPRSLNLNNEHYCATCDGAFFKDKTVAVVGGGNTAFQEALYLSNLAKTVHLVHRSTFRADQILQDRIASTENIKTHVPAYPTTYENNTLALDNGESLEIDGLFVAIGRDPNTKILDSSLANLDTNGYVVSSDCTTKTPGLFVAGDVRTKGLRQLITASSDGATAAKLAIDYLN